MNKKKRTATPSPAQGLSSSVTIEPALEPMPDSVPSPISDTPQDAGNLPSYRPPAVVPSIPTPPHSETAESPSSMKSKPTSTPPRTAKPTPAPEPSSDAPPAKCPVQGEGGVDYLNWSAGHYDDERFRATYESRAAHMVKLHGDKLRPTTVKRLQGLL